MKWTANREQWVPALDSIDGLKPFILLENRRWRTVIFKPEQIPCFLRSQSTRLIRNLCRSATFLTARLFPGAESQGSQIASDYSLPARELAP